MQLENSFTVPVPIDEAWRVLLDIERIAPCMPGAALDTVDGDDFTGRVKVKLGPINLTYQGKASFIEKDEAAHKAVIDARGKDQRGNGTAAAVVTAKLAAEGDITRVDVLTDLNITGRPAQFGRGVMTDVGNKLLGQFADKLAAQLGEGDAQGDAARAKSRRRGRPPATAAGRRRGGRGVRRAGRQGNGAGGPAAKKAAAATKKAAATATDKAARRQGGEEAPAKAAGEGRPGQGGAAPRTRPAAARAGPPETAPAAETRRRRRRPPAVRPAGPRRRRTGRARVRRVRSVPSAGPRGPASGRSRSRSTCSRSPAVRPWPATPPRPRGLRHASR